MGIKVNMSAKEATSVVQDPLPAGKYLIAVTDGELKFSKSAKNNGKPFYALELVVQDGKYDGRKVFTNVMCFEGALYSISQILKADGAQVTTLGNGADAVVTFQVEGFEENEIPELEYFLGKQYVVKLSIEPEKTVKVNGEDKTYPKKNEVKGWLPSKGWDGGNVSTPAGAPATGKNPLLP
jgi:hypothetical protein